MKSKLNTGIALILLLFVALLIASVFVTSDVVAKANNKNVVSLENFFIDIDGDGNLDYIKAAEIIFNEATEQPENLP